MQDNDVAEFIHDESFLNYCFDRNDDDVRHWKKWLQENPEYESQVDAIKTMVIIMAKESGNRLKQLHFSELQEKIAQFQPRTFVKKMVLWTRIAAAASIILALSVGSYLFLRKRQPKQMVNIQRNDIAPIGNKATLTLSGGQQIILDTRHHGQLARQSNVVVRQAGNGVITYTADQKDVDDNHSPTFNTITTSGGQYALQLSDGTKVWLNSASSITYPVAFSGKDRKVAITGEVYFEVVHNEAKPFSVVSQGQTVQVLGTHFVINAYTDEARIKTTLLEGSIKISKAGQFKKLSPGQQADVNFDSNNINVTSGVDVEKAIAWKNGLFSYDRTDLREVMRQLARAYEVQVEYEGEVPDRTFTGKIHRNLNASEALDILKFTRVNFRIAGKKIIVTP